MDNSIIEKAKKLIEIVEKCGGTGSQVEETYWDDAINIIKEFIQEKLQEKLPQRYSKRDFSKSSHYYQLSEIIFYSANKLRNTYTRYLENPEAMEIVLQNNAYEIFKLVEKEHRPIQEVIDVLEWVLHDEFWQGNILSASKFKEQYDDLRIQKFGRVDPDPEMTKKLVGIFRALSSNPSYKPHDGSLARFIEAGKKVKEFFGSRELDPDQGIEYLLNCLAKNFVDKGQIVHPGNLCSDYTWDVIMPQYMAEIGIE